MAEKTEIKKDQDVVSDAKVHEDDTPNVSTSFNTTPALRESTKDVSAVVEGQEEQGDYEVLDLVMYLTVPNEDNTKVKAVRRFRRGDTVKLSATLARTLTLEPRPSVRKKEAGE